LARQREVDLERAGRRSGSKFHLLDYQRFDIIPAPVGGNSAQFLKSCCQGGQFPLSTRPNALFWSAEEIGFPRITSTQQLRVAGGRSLAKGIAAR
jgi:hypothetical protein